MDLSDMTLRKGLSKNQAINPSGFSFSSVVPESESIIRVRCCFLAQIRTPTIRMLKTTKNLIVSMNEMFGYTKICRGQVPLSVLAGISGAPGS